MSGVAGLLGSMCARPYACVYTSFPPCTTATLADGTPRCSITPNAIESTRAFIAGSIMSTVWARTAEHQAHRPNIAPRTIRDFSMRLTISQALNIGETLPHLDPKGRGSLNAIRRPRFLAVGWAGQAYEKPCQFDRRRHPCRHQ